MLFYSMSSFDFSLHLVFASVLIPLLHRIRPTAAVSRWWAGRGNATLPEPTSIREKCLKRAESHQSGACCVRRYPLGLSAKVHRFAVRLHIPEAAGHHARGSVSRKGNPPA